MKSFTAILALAAAVNAHMIMRTPTPANSPNNSPLAADGSDYPCKGALDVSKGSVNQINVGVPQTLSFTGSATHGGGSCQVSLAKGLTVSASTKWMVIHSIEGGCPADTAGNLANDPSGTGAATFKFTVPDHPDLPPGEYTLAWTWHNKIGNREMYMNCANVNLQGAQKKRYAPTNFSKRQSAPLPDMFKANIGAVGNGCSTTEGIDVQYPNPGSSLETSPDAKLGPPVGNCGSSSGSSSPAKGSSAAPSATTSTAKTAGASPAASSSISQSVGGGFATVSGSGSAPTAASSAAAQQPSAAASTATSAAAPVGTGTSGTPSTGASGSCNVGDWSCAADGKSFQRCIAGGTWSASISMSAGLSCTPGVSSNFGYNRTGGNQKRDLRTHISRRHNSLQGAIIS